MATAPDVEIEAPVFPVWADQVRSAYSRVVSSCFIVHGSGITDYAVNENKSVLTQLDEVWDYLGIPITAHYSLAKGLEFPILHDVKTGEPFSPSQKTFIDYIRQPGSTTPDADLLMAYRDPVVAFEKFDQLLQARETKDEVGRDGQHHLVDVGPLFALIIDGAEYLVPDFDMAGTPNGQRQMVAYLERWGRLKAVLNSGNTVTLLTRDLLDIHRRLRLADSKYEAIEIAIPTYTDRRLYIAYSEGRIHTENDEAYLTALGLDATADAAAIAKAEKAQPTVVRALDLTYEPDFTADAFARITAGLSRVGIEDIIYKVPPGACITRAMVRERKNAITKVEYADVVELMDPTGGFETFGGYDYLKAILRKRVIEPMRRGEPADWPGILFIGPPGTGKTMLVATLAHEIGLPAVRLHIGSLKNRFLGESEKNMRRALAFAREMAPCVVFTDELDGAFPNRATANDTDSGVGRTLLTMYMQFISDPDIRTKVLFIGASNRPDTIDAALKRVGRYDRQVPLVAPSAESRGQILRLLLGQDDPAIPEVVAQTQNWTSAELVDLVETVKQLRKDREGGLVEAMSMLRPNTEEVAEMTKLAIDSCNDLRLIDPALLSLRAKADEPRTGKAPTETRRKAN